MPAFLKSQADLDKALADAGDKLVVIDFTANWCGPCKMIGPKFEAMAEEITDVVFYKIDVDDADEVAASCGIQCMPTFQFYKNGAKVDTLEGAAEEQLRAKVASNK